MFCLTPSSARNKARSAHLEKDPPGCRKRRLRFLPRKWWKRGCSRIGGHSPPADVVDGQSYCILGGGTTDSTGQTRVHRNQSFFLLGGNVCVCVLPWFFTLLSSQVLSTTLFSLAKNVKNLSYHSISFPLKKTEIKNSTSKKQEASWRMRQDERGERVGSKILCDFRQPLGWTGIETTLWKVFLTCLN